MIIGIHQPQYLPWLGLIDRIEQCDIFVILDNVPYSKNYFYNRNRIKTSKGWMWLTIPVLFTGRFGQLIKDIKIDNTQDWRRKHLRSIYYEYKKSPYFDFFYPPLKELLNTDWENLSDLSSESMILLVNLFGLSKQIVKASDLQVDGAKENLLINICMKLKADIYLSGPDGKSYLNLNNWNNKGIRVVFQDFKHPKYPQLFNGFIPQMSAIDLLFNCGPESLNILKDKYGEKVELILK